MTAREKEIIALLRTNPMMTQKELAGRLGIERSSVAVHITNLMKKGMIQGKGYIISAEDHIAVVGASNVDLVAQAHDMRTGDSVPGTISLSAGGVGRNIAEAIARLDVPVKLLSALGDDPHGRMILEECRQVGIDVNQIMVDPGLSTSAYMALVDQTGEMVYAINDMASVSAISTAYLKKYTQVLTHARVVVFDSNLTEEAIGQVALSGHEKLLADPVSTVKALKLKPYLANLYGLKPNKLEAEALTGITITSTDQALKAIDALHDQGLGHVALSMGQEGMIASDGKRVIQYKLPAHHALNVTGAGDVFTATWAVFLQKGYDFFDCIQMAMYAARFNVLSAATIHEALCIEQIENDRKEVKIDEQVLRYSS